MAVKMLYCIELTPDIISSFINEANLLTLMNSNHIVKLIGALYFCSASLFAKQAGFLVTGVCILPPSVCLVMELCRGNLENHVRNNRTLFLSGYVLFVVIFFTCQLNLQWLSGWNTCYKRHRLPVFTC